jgi:hypothetical protein
MRRMIPTGVAGLLALLLGVPGCEIGPESGSGLRLPNGDVRAGERAFRELGCGDCHVIAGEGSWKETADGHTVVVLGGKVPHIETYGELITSIVNPSHGLTRRYPRKEVTEGDQSRMKPINETMTVAQLIDLTAFLQSKYDLELNQVYGP